MEGNFIFKFFKQFIVRVFFFLVDHICTEHLHVEYGSIYANIIQNKKGNQNEYQVDLISFSISNSTQEM